MAVIDNLVSYWALDEASGNGVDAHGSTTLTDNNTVGAGTGKIAGSRLFTRASNERLTTASPPVTAVPMSISLWFKAASTSTNMNLAVTKQAGNNHASGVSVSTGNRATFYASNGSGTFDTLTGTTAISTATWYHLVAVWRSATDRELYINAASEGTATASRTITSPTSFALGAYGSTDHWDGDIDEAGIWTKALTPTEITWLYNSGSGRSYADIVAEATSVKSLVWWNTFGQVAS